MVNGVQAKLLEARLGIFSGVWAPAAPLTQAVRAAPARILAHRVLRASRLQTDFNSTNENICTPIRGAVPDCRIHVRTAPSVRLGRLAIDCWKVLHPCGRLEILRALSPTRRILSYRCEVAKSR